MNLGRTWLVAVAVAAVLAGCASGVKLDNPAPVVNRSAQAPQSPPPAPPAIEPMPAAGGTASQSQVVPATPSPPVSNLAGPAAVSRLIMFDYDSFVIKPDYLTVIEAHARFLKANPGRRVAIEGHTDERGGREYNLALGQKRAEAVRKALALAGAADSQMEAVSFGKEKPANSGATEAAYAENRRAEIVYR